LSLVGGEDHADHRLIVGVEPVVLEGANARGRGVSRLGWAVVEPEHGLVLVKEKPRLLGRDAELVDGLHGRPEKQTTNTKNNNKKPTTTHNHKPNQELGC